jgi:hypothetical protein
MNWSGRVGVKGREVILTGIEGVSDKVVFAVLTEDKI